MRIKQISVFLENNVGSLFGLTEVLSKENVDMLSLNIADTEDYGVARILVDEPEKVCEMLTKYGFTVRDTDVLLITGKNTPGILHNTLSILKENDINIEYTYVFAYGGIANMIFRVDDIEVADKLFKNDIN